MDNLRDSIAVRIQEWNQDHEANARTYSPEDLSTDAYQQGRLQELKKIYLDFYANKENRNDIALKNLKNKVDVMERQLYKSPAARLWERIKDAISAAGHIKRVKVEQQMLFNEVLSLSSKADLPYDYMSQIAMGARELKLPNNQYHQMSSTDVMNYDYHLSATSQGLTTTYNVRVFSTENPGNINEVKFQHRTHQWLNREQIYNMASGGSVLHVDKMGNEKWLKLNPVDKDKNGNTQVMEVSGHDFNVKEAFGASKLKGELSESAEAHLMVKLKNGNAVHIRVPQSDGNEKVFRVQADPLRRTLDISEQRGKNVAGGDARNTIQAKPYVQRNEQQPKPRESAKPRATRSVKKRQMKALK